MYTFEKISYALSYISLKFSLIKFNVLLLNRLVDSSINQDNLKELGIIKAISISEGYDVNYSMTHAKELYKSHLIKIIKDLK